MPTARGWRPDDLPGAREAARVRSCECKGWLRWQHCRHVEALTAASMAAEPVAT